MLFDLLLVSPGRDKGAPKEKKIEEKKKVDGEQVLGQKKSKSRVILTRRGGVSGTKSRKPPACMACVVEAGYLL